MVRRALRSRSLKRRQVRTPGGRNVVQYRKKKPSHHKCGKCGVKLNRSKLRVTQTSKLSKTQRRPERPYPELCSKCMREKFRELVR
jgi:large subunit ribosomal protein L34e